MCMCAHAHRILNWVHLYFKLLKSNRWLGDWDWHVYSDVYKIDDWLKKKECLYSKQAWNWKIVSPSETEANIQYNDNNVTLCIKGLLCLQPKKKKKAIGGKKKSQFDLCNIWL